MFCFPVKSHMCTHTHKDMLTVEKHLTNIECLFAKKKGKREKKWVWGGGWVEPTHLPAVGRAGFLSLTLWPPPRTEHLCPGSPAESQLRSCGPRAWTRACAGTSPPRLAHLHTWLLEPWLKSGTRYCFSLYSTSSHWIHKLNVTTDLGISHCPLEILYT